MDNISVNKLKFKYEIGDTLKCKTSFLTITNKEIRKGKQYDNKTSKLYNSNQKWYQLKCQKCGYDNIWKQENQVLLTGCPCCSSNIIVKNINSFGAYYPELLQYFVNIEDSYTIGHGSKKEMLLECPICKNQRYMSAYILQERGFKCNKCNDSISYPEKFMMAFLNQCNIKYIYQLSKKHFSWCDKYKYDFYLPDYNCIIETNGEQHYGNIFTCSNAKTYDELLSNDLEKKALALSNDIEFYEWIDCSQSNAEKIISSIKESKLCQILNIDINNIDINYCDIEANKNILKEVCDFYNHNKNMTAPMIAPYFNLHRHTILDYLKKGTKLGLCNYNIEEVKIQSRIKGAKHVGEIKSKPVEAFDKNKSIGIFKNAKSVVEYFDSQYSIKLVQSNISCVCLGKYKHHKGYTFKYISKEEYNNRQLEQKDLKT